MGCAEAGATSTVKQQCTSGLTLSSCFSPPFVSMSALSFSFLISPYLSQCTVSTLSLSFSLWASIILSFFPIPIFNLSLCSAPFLFSKPVIHSFLSPLPSISLCLFISYSFIIETWSAGLSLSLSVKNHTMEI